MHLRPQAYVEPTTLELTGGGGVNPLESDSVVEANNTLILLSGNATSYRALEVRGIAPFPPSVNLLLAHRAS